MNKDGNNAGSDRVECLRIKNWNSNLKPEPISNTGFDENPSAKLKQVDIRNPIGYPKHICVAT